MKEMKFPVSPRPFSRLVVVFACLAAAMAFVANNSLAQGPFLIYQASAYGTYAFVGSTVTVGQTAPVSIGANCGTAQTGLTVSGTVATLNATPIAVTGLVNTSATDALNQATATSDVHNISLLGGLITATEVKAVSTTFKKGASFHVSGTGSSLVNLIIAGGLPINVVPAPNTTIALAGFGKVVLNEQIRGGGGTSGTEALTVNMIHVYVTTSNVLNIAVGTQIIVADASTRLTLINGPAFLDGTAFGTVVNGTLVTSSRTAPVNVSCLGNALITNTQVGINVLSGVFNVLSAATISDTAQGSVTSTESSAQTTADIQTANVLTGIVQASVIHGQANASTTDGVAFNFSTSGSFASLSVSGHPEITASVSANTQVNLAGIGTLYLKRSFQTSNNIGIRMIEVDLASGNTLGLPTGTQIIVGAASASLHSPTHP